MIHTVQGCFQLTHKIRHGTKVNIVKISFIFILGSNINKCEVVNYIPAMIYSIEVKNEYTFLLKLLILWKPT